MSIELGKLAPALSALTHQGTWTLGENRFSSSTCVFFCPKLSTAPFLLELERRLAEFTSIGVEVIVITSGTMRNVRASEKLCLGWELTTQAAFEWGLIQSEDPEYGLSFGPAMFIVGNDMLIHEAVVSSSPLWRPNLDQIVQRCQQIALGNVSTSPPVSGPVPNDLGMGMYTFPNGRGQPPVWVPRDQK